MARAVVPVELRLEIEDFLAREAELLDERHLTAWLALFADDARYAVRLREPPPPPRPSTLGGAPSAGVQGEWRSQYPAPHPAGGSGVSPEHPPSSPGVQGRSPAGGLGVSPNAPSLSPQDWGAGGADLLFEDDKAFLALRVRRLETRLAHAERPPSTTRHLISNVIVEPAEGDEVAVRASFVVYQVRPGLADQLFFGQRQDRLRKVAGEWRIARRLVTLDQNPLPRTLTIFF
jgi:3-phenylpropionate/cinnamic acid dioxygenase small subunit